MEEFDPAQEREIWQRVCARQTEGDPQLRKWMLESMEKLAAYRRLAEQLTGTARERAKQLYAGEQAALMALRGLSLLSGAGAERIRTLPPPREQTRRVLELCYHRSQQTAAEFTARSVHPEWGVVFEELAKQQREQCVMLARLLGEVVS